MYFCAKIGYDGDTMIFEKRPKELAMSFLCCCGYISYRKEAQQFSVQ